MQVTALLTGRQAQALVQALAMLGHSPPGGSLTDAWLSTVPADALTRAGALCGPRTAMLLSTYVTNRPAPVAAPPAPPASAPVAVAPEAAPPAPVAVAPVAPTGASIPVAQAFGAPDKRAASEVFGVDLASTITVDCYGRGAPRDKHYLFRAEVLRPLLAAWQVGLAAWIYGPPGTGKTSMISEIGARTNRPVFRVNFSDGVDRSDLLGSDTLSGGDIAFRAGSVLQALRTPGAILLLDEPSSARPEDLICLHPVLDGSGEAIIPQTGERISIAPGVNIVICDNTNGSLDRAGIYPGLRPQSLAFRDRFGAFISIDHLTVAQESRIIVKRSGVDRDKAKAIAKTVHASRQLAAREQAPEAAISHRQCIAWASLMSAGMSAEESFTSAVAARHDGETAEALKALYRNQWGASTDAAPATEAGGEDESE